MSLASKIILNSKDKCSFEAAKMKIIIVNIYFGKRPGYFDFFLQSCANNPAVDFLFFVDFEVPNELPSNIRIVKSTFQEIRNRFQSRFEFPITLNSAYKLCDFRPAYGDLFADYFSGYDWWGHCDFDMVFGDLGPVVDVARQAQYVKIFRRGHLTLYKNSAEINGVYKSDLGPLNYRDVFTSEKFCLFDETNGIDKTFTSMQLPVFRDEWIADIKPMSPFLFMTAHSNHWGQYFVWSQGKLKRKSQVGDDRYFLYIHLQKRRMAEQYQAIESTEAAILINQFGFFDFSESFKMCFTRYISFIPNLTHLWRYYLPRIINIIKRKTMG